MDRIPADVKEKLLKFADRLPKDQAREFLRNVTKEIGDFTAKHPRTVTYAMVGFVLGEMVERLPVIGPILGDNVGEIVGLIGGIKGFADDRNKVAIHEIIAREIRKAAEGIRT